MSDIRGFGPPPSPQPLDPLELSASSKDETSASTVSDSEARAPSTANEIQSMCGDDDADPPLTIDDRIRQMTNHMTELEQKLVLEQSESFRLRQQVLHLQTALLDTHNHFTRTTQSLQGEVARLQAAARQTQRRGLRIPHAFLREDEMQPDPEEASEMQLAQDEMMRDLPQMPPSSSSPDTDTNMHMYHMRESDIDPPLGQFDFDPVDKPEKTGKDITSEEIMTAVKKGSEGTESTSAPSGIVTKVRSETVEKAGTKIHVSTSSPSPTIPQSSLSRTHDPSPIGQGSQGSPLAALDSHRTVVEEEFMQVVKPKNAPETVMSDSNSLADRFLADLELTHSRKSKADETPAADKSHRVDSPLSLTASSAVEEVTPPRLVEEVTEVVERMNAIALTGRGIREPMRTDPDFKRLTALSFPSLFDLHSKVLTWWPWIIILEPNIAGEYVNSRPLHEVYAKIRTQLMRIEGARAAKRASQVGKNNRSSASTARVTTVSAAITVNKTEAKGPITGIIADVRLDAASSTAAAASSSAHAAAAGRSTRSFQSDSFGHDDLVLLWPRISVIGVDDDKLNALLSNWRARGAFAIFGLVQSTDANHGPGAGATVDSSDATAAAATSSTKVDQPSFKLQLYFDSSDPNSGKALFDLRQGVRWMMCRVQNFGELHCSYFNQRRTYAQHLCATPCASDDVVTAPSLPALRVSTAAALDIDASSTRPPSPALDQSSHLRSPSAASPSLFSAVNRPLNTQPTPAKPEPDVDFNAIFAEQSPFTASVLSSERRSNQQLVRKPVDFLRPSSSAAEAAAAATSSFIAAAASTPRTMSSTPPIRSPSPRSDFFRDAIDASHAPNADASDGPPSKRPKLSDNRSEPPRATTVEAAANYSNATSPTRSRASSEDDAFECGTVVSHDPMDELHDAPEDFMEAWESDTIQPTTTERHRQANRTQQAELARKAEKAYAADKPQRLYPSLSDLHRELLVWCPSKIGSAVAHRLEQVPPVFVDVGHYQSVMYPLLVEEFRAGLELQLDEISVMQLAIQRAIQRDPYSRSSKSLHATSVSAAITVNKTEAKGQITSITADVRLGAASSTAAAASSSAHAAAAGRSTRSFQSDSFGHDDLVLLWPRHDLIGADDDDALASCWSDAPFTIFGLLQSTDANHGPGTATVDSSDATAAAATTSTKVDQPSFKLQLYFDSSDPNSDMALLDLRQGARWMMCRVKNLRTLHRQHATLASCAMMPLGLQIFQPAWARMASPTDAIPSPTESTDTMVLAGLPRHVTVDRLLPLLPSPIAGRFNDEQRWSIAAALTNTSGFTLVQGRPRTGKTSTIVGLANMLYLQHQAKLSLRDQPSNDRPDSHTEPEQTSPCVPHFRLLICAPSNAAIDDLTDRLEGALVDQVGEKLALNIVRLESDGGKDTRSPATNGRSKAERTPFHTRVSLEQLVRERIAERKAANVRSAGASISKATQTQTQPHHSAASSSNSEPLTLRDHFKADLLTHAHIVCTTIDGADSDFLRQLGLSFPTVIIDDSTQVSEAQTLIPLQHRATRCVLFGDPTQNRAAARSLSCQSLFERLQNHGFEAAQLHWQYRMHWEITRRPSKIFYDDRLKNEPKPWAALHAVLQPSPDARLPYAIYAAMNQEEMGSDAHVYSDPADVEVAVQLFAFLRHAWEASNSDGGARDPLAFVRSVGIISVDPQQVLDLRRAFARLFTPDELPHLEIGSVDSFQGREKEFILFSTLRYGGDLAWDQDWLNVALTRAVDVLTRTNTREQDDTWWQLLQDARQRIIATTREGRILDFQAGRPEKSIVEIEADSSMKVGASQVVAHRSVLDSSPSDSMLDSASVGAESDRDSIGRHFGDLSLARPGDAAQHRNPLTQDALSQPDSASPVMVEHADAMPTDGEEKL